MVARLGFCAQQICEHFAPRLGVDERLAVGMGSAFGTGMGHADVCGCISGALMGLGIRYGSASTLEEGKLRKPLLVQKVTEFDRRFSEMQPCRSCRDILGMDITQPGVMKQAAEQGLFKSVCQEMTKRTCAILEDMLNEDDEQDSSGSGSIS